MDWLDRVRIYFVHSDALHTPNNWLYHYQTLIAGFAALAAAFLTVIYIREQIKVSKEHHSELLDRQYRAARSNLPLSLSELSEYAQDCIVVLSRLLSQRDFNTALGEGFNELQMPRLPSSALANITNLIALTSKADAEKLQSVLRHIQVQHSRLRSAVDDRTTEGRRLRPSDVGNLRHYVVDACVLMKMTAFLFSFARWETESIPDFDGSTFSGSLEYVVRQAFDEETVQFATSRIVAATQRAFDSKR